MTTATLSKAAKNNASQTFGLEIEVLWKGTTCQSTGGQKVAEYLNGKGFPQIRYAGYTHGSIENWKVVYDASVNGRNAAGLEVVSPILKGQEGLAEAGALLNALAECDDIIINKTCGIHVHLGAAQWTLNQHRQFAALNLTYEGALMTTLPASRQNSRWCQRNERDLSAQIKGIKNAQSFDQIGSIVGSRHERYRTWNYNCFSRHGTVECRMHGGSMDETKVTTWISLMLHMAGYAASLKDTAVRFDGRVRTADSATRLSFITKGLPKKGREYLAGRVAAHAGRRLNAAG